MAGALKKYLAGLNLQPGDVLLYKTPWNVPESAWRPFLEEVSRQVPQHTIVVLAHGYTLEKISDEEAEHAGFMRLVDREAVERGATVAEIRFLAHQHIDRVFDQVAELTKAEA